jgi:rhamnogalacturonan endolyase
MSPIVPKTSHPPEAAEIICDPVMSCRPPPILLLVLASLLLGPFCISTKAQEPPVNSNILVGVDTELDLAKSSLKDNGVVEELGESHDGSQTLHVVIKEADGAKGGAFGIVAHIRPPRNLDDSRALHFALKLPLDTRARVTGDQRLRVLIYSGRTHAGDWIFTGHVLTPGWNEITCDFGEKMSSLPATDALLISMGLSRGFGQADISIGPVELVPMPPPPAGDLDALAMLLRDQDIALWPRRYQAVTALQALGPAAVPALTAACSDAVLLVRNHAKDALSAQGSTSVAPLLDNLTSPSILVRKSSAQLLGKLAVNTRNVTVLNGLAAAMLDPDFYVRDAAVASLQEIGISNQAIVDAIAARLNPLEQPSERLLAARVLGEMSIRPGLKDSAQSVVPQLLRITEDAREDLLLRLMALVGAWKLDEDSVMLADWLLPLGSEPGTAHRHLLDKAMTHLQLGGAASVPLLQQALKSPNPTVRTRAGAVLALIGPAARDAVPALLQALRDGKWYVRWQALDALHKIGFSDGQVVSLTGYVPDVQPPAMSDLPPVAINQDASHITVDNGLVRLVFDRNREDGPISFSRIGDGRNLLKGVGFIQWTGEYYLLGDTREFKVVSASPQSVDISIHHLPDAKALDIDVHYVVQQGRSGYYFYCVLRKSAAQPATPISDFNYILRLPDPDPFTHQALNDKLQGPNLNGDQFSDEQKEEVQDIFQATFRQPDGELDAKHEWNEYELLGPVIGAYGPGAGLWAIIPSFESVSAFPNYTNLSAAHGVSIIAMDNQYYVHSSIVANGDFEKIYGPYFIYANTGENGAEMWTDAKRQAAVEVASWPYPWVANAGYHQRATVKGRLTISDGSSPAGAWVLLSHPDPVNGWQWEQGPYLFFVRAAADGSFVLPNVRPGQYALSIDQAGVWGEFRLDNVVVTDGATVDLGDLRFTPESHGKTIWQIGIPDRTSKEFRNGNNFHQWDNLLTYRPCFPHDVNYFVGKSDYTKDWNYIQPERVPGETAPVPWKIHFTLDKPPSAKSWLTIAICSTRDTKLDVLLNGTQIAEYDYVYDKTDDSAGIRSCPYGYYSEHVIPLDPSQLKAGENVITLVQTRDGNWSYVMYDCIRMESEEPPDLKSAK